MALEQLDQRLQESESRYPDIIDGTAKQVRWYDGVKQTDLSLVYIHGFSASAREISPVTERLADQLGANVFYTRLAGHGRSEDAMADSSIARWQADALQAWRIGQTIGKTVVVISVSTGGTLATWLATQPEVAALAANILISPNFGIGNRIGEIVRWEWGLKLARWMGGPYREFTPQNAVHKKYWTERYPIEAVVPMVKLVDLVNKLDLSTVKVPHFFIYSPDDAVIRVSSIKDIEEKLDPKITAVLAYTDSRDPYQHVLAGDACSPQTTDDMVAILADYIQALDFNKNK